MPWSAGVNASIGKVPIASWPLAASARVMPRSSGPAYDGIEPFPDDGPRCVVNHLLYLGGEQSFRMSRW
jgi:hypothetical protein